MTLDVSYMRRYRQKPISKDLRRSTVTSLSNSFLPMSIIWHYEQNLFKTLAHWMRWRMSKARAGVISQWKCSCKQRKSSCRRLPGPRAARQLSQGRWLAWQHRYASPTSRLDSYWKELAIILRRLILSSKTTKSWFRRWQNLRRAGVWLWIRSLTQAVTTNCDASPQP